MTCCEGWTSCNGFSLLFLVLLGVILNAVPVIVNRVDEGQFFHNPISCFEWWFPGIIGAGLMVIPATAASLAARKRACCNSRSGMFLSSLLNLLTLLGALYCMLVSLWALLEGPLICNSPDTGAPSCAFTLDNLRFQPNSFNLQWYLNESCVPDGLKPSTTNGTTASDWKQFSSKQEKHKTIHLSVFTGLLLVGSLEVLFGLSQMVIGLLGCLCGVSRRRNRIV